MIPFNSEPISRPAVAAVPAVEESVSKEPVEAQLSTPTLHQPVRVSIGELETFFTDVPEEESEEEEDEEEEYSEVIDDLGDLMKSLIEEMATIFADKVAEELIAKFKNLS
jgi:hypothetical protein